MKLKITNELTVVITMDKILHFKKTFYHRIYKIILFNWYPTIFVGTVTYEIIQNSIIFLEKNTENFMFRAWHNRENYRHKQQH